MNNPVHTVPFTAMSYGTLADAKQAAKEFANTLKVNCYEADVVVSTTNQECLVMWCRTVASQALHEYIKQVAIVTNRYKEKKQNGAHIDEII